MLDSLNCFTLKKLGIYTTIIVIFTYNILLNRDVTCSCEKQVTECGLYFTLPGIIVLFLILWMDKKFIKICRYSVTECTCCYGWYIVYHSVKATFIALLWIVTLLIDGDWYVCCSNFTNQTMLACINEKMTPTEQRAFVELKNTSRIIGFGVFLGIVVIMFVMSVCHQSKRCNKKNGKKYMFDYLVLKEENNVLKEKLKAKVVEALTEAFDAETGEDRWVKYSEVAKELINQTEATREQPPAAQDPGSRSQSSQQQQGLQQEPPAEAQEFKDKGDTDDWFGATGPIDDENDQRL
ncbi:uncharacterized protein LOC114869047 isoform X2 [Betta splendens]|uniref:Uncharacterized protein LOC114869047 isoform X2 n=1 Tax=Betta splendens TaxID=158456 RepID=A0A9W2Y7M2_BETSP|nr:uncharacterized protein LOC114869047 isoform X2 [Betta splendens]